jgi:caffeoyl-CoA O-methyltransferase
MEELIGPALARYTEQHTQPPSELLQELVGVTLARAADPQMQVGQVEGAFLRMLVTLLGARRVIEVGTFTGYSALSMAEALPEGGKLITCDIDEKVVAIARSFFARSPHGSKIEVRMGNAADTLRAMPKDESVDLVFLDADKEGYVTYYELALPLLRRGGLIVADNTLWSGRVLDPQSASDKGIHAFNVLVTKDPRVDNVLLSIRDGIMVARKL